MNFSAPFVRKASRHQRVLGPLLLVAGLVYLASFVERGWIPHDEGMIGSTAEHVLAGGIPHIDYQEPYTGGLSWLYAAVFKVGGVDLAHIRWLVFTAAGLSQWFTYLILRRFLTPLGAALGTWVALVWSFPNYFTGLPSWWILIFAIISTWSLIRYHETSGAQYLVAAGFAAGLALVVKQTGIYVLIAVCMSVLFVPGESAANKPSHAVLMSVFRKAFAIGSVMFVLFILSSRLAVGDLLYLLSPILACALVLWRQSMTSVGLPINRLLIVLASAAVPFCCLIIPYVGANQLLEFLYAVFVLPQKRLTYASWPMPMLSLAVPAVGMVGLMLFAPRMDARFSRLFNALRWAIAPSLIVLCLVNSTAYGFIWQSSRAIGGLLPVVACWLLYSQRVIDRRHQTVLYTSASILAWASLGQFPYSAPIYFCYVTPLVVIAGVATAQTGGWLNRPGLLPWSLLLLAFGLVSMNRGSIGNLGGYHESETLETRLNLARANLRVSGAQAAVYRRLVTLVSEHGASGPLVAGPDCPEVYFLTGQLNPLGSSFEFLLENNDESPADQTKQWLRAGVIVINHSTYFSPPFPSSLLTELRQEFPNSENIGKFEVRWR